MHSHICCWCKHEWHHKDACGQDRLTICPDCALDQLTSPLFKSRAFVPQGK